jgi:hypothetical protein
MNTKAALGAILLLIPQCLEVSAQQRGYLRIRERPVVWFDFDCTTESAYPKVRLNRLVKRYLRKIPYDIGKWGNRAFGFDLNGDRVKEFFVPLDCGATGNCNWQIFTINPTRSLGIVNGENIWIHKRKYEWSDLTIASHLNASESLLRTYRFKSGKYRRFGADYVESAYKKNSPMNLYLAEPTCDPDWIPQRLRE